MIDIQYGITIMGGREVSRPYRVWFFAEGERFLSTALTTGAKHRHRQKVVFYVFVFFDSIHDSATMHTLSPGFSTEMHQLVGVGK